MITDHEKRARNLALHALQQATLDDVPHLGLIIYAGRLIEAIAKVTNEPGDVEDKQAVVEMLLNEALIAAERHQRTLEIEGLRRMFNTPSAEQ